MKSLGFEKKGPPRPLSPEQRGSETKVNTGPSGSTSFQHQNFENDSSDDDMLGRLDSLIAARGPEQKKTEPAGQTVKGSLLAGQPGLQKLAARVEGVTVQSSLLPRANEVGERENAVSRFKEVGVSKSSEAGGSKSTQSIVRKSEENAGDEGPTKAKLIWRPTTRNIPEKLRALEDLIPFGDRLRPFAGVVFALGGSFEVGSGVAKVLARRGGKVVAKVTRPSEVLVIGGGADAEEKAARKLGALIVTEDELSDFLNEHLDETLAEAVEGADGEDDIEGGYFESSKYIESQTPEAPVAPLVRTRDPQRPWTDQFAPCHSSEILGNSEAVGRLRGWLASWRDSGEGRRAALLTGPPGSGKSSAAALIARELRWELVATHAADQRGRAAFAGSLAVLRGNRVLRKKGGEGLGRCLILMDEVDSLAADRGGAAGLAEMIRLTRIPIICIADDRQSAPARLLAPLCVDLRFRALEPRELAPLLRRAAGAGDDATLARLTESCRGDARQALNRLQFWRDELLRPIDGAPPGDPADVPVPGAFEAAARLLAASRRPRNSALLREIRGLFCSDAAMMPAFVFEGYLPSGGGLESLKRIEEGLDGMCLGEQIAKVLRTQRDYSVLPALAHFAGAVPTLACERSSRLAGFPALLAHSASRRKRARQFREARDCLAAFSPGLGPAALRSTIPILLAEVSGLISRGEHSQVLALYTALDLNPALVRDSLEDIAAAAKAPGINASTAAKTAFSKYFTAHSGFRRIGGKDSKKDTDKQVLLDSEEERDPDQANPEEENLPQFQIDDD